MTNYNEIPLEIWTNVFKFTEQPRHLIECRLVCKRWNYPAETAMFSKDLKIHRTNSIIKLRNHLAKSPLRALLVRYLDVFAPDPENDMLELIKVAFNPNLEYWRASSHLVDSKVISTVLEIVEGLPEDTVYQLRKIPVSRIKGDENYARAIKLFENQKVSFWQVWDGSGDSPHKLKTPIKALLGRTTCLGDEEITMPEKEISRKKKDKEEKRREAICFIKKSRKTND